MSRPNWDRNVFVIPCAPDWNVLFHWYDKEKDKDVAIPEPIIAWVVTVDSDPDQHGKNFASSAPLTAGGTGPHEDATVQTPDGKVMEYESTTWRNVSDWLEDQRNARLKKLKEPVPALRPGK